jgi:F-type H+-transporting ATPase subunit gamma
MAHVREIKSHLKGIRNIYQITNAMKMVASARLKRAQDRILSNRPYAFQLSDVVRNLSQKLDEKAHPLLKSRSEGQTILLVITADRGLCGSFNVNILRRAQSFLKENTLCTVLTVGRKSHDFFKRRAIAIHRSWMYLFPEIPYSSALEISNELINLFTQEQFKEVVCIFNEFKSSTQQKVTLIKLLPIRTEKKSNQLDSFKNSGMYLFEPSESKILEELLPHYLATNIYRMLLESFSSEMGAKMNAMEAASKNAIEMIRKLTLEFNRARQDMITKEISEIVSGAEALK